MRRTLRIIAIGLGVAGASFCARTPPSRELPASNLSVPVRGNCSSPGSADYFFPDKVFAPWDRQFLDAPRVYYGLFLAAMQEPSLSCGDDQPDSYRLMRLDYTGVPLSVRVAKEGRGALTWTKLEAPTWMLPPGGVLSTGRASVSDGAWRDLETEIDATGFWHMTTNEVVPRDDPGTAWILEARRGRRYHIVNRASPSEGPYRNVGLALLQLAGINEADLGADAPGVTPRPFKHPPHIPGLPPPPEPPPPPPPRKVK